MIVIVVLCIHKSFLGKRLVNICSVSVYGVPNGVTGFFLPIFQFHEGDGMVYKVKNR